MKKFIRSYVSALVIVLTLSAISFAQTAPGKNFPNVKIKNFGQMDERFYRGAQPKESDYQSLKDLGITTVIDLRDDPTSYEKAAVEALGMKYVHIPMIAKKYPKPESVEAFLKIVNDPSTGAFYVHCAGGRHRTGVMGAVYRFTKYGWNFDQVYKEMKNYDFYTRFGHGDFKDFVVDYAEKMKNNQAAAQTTRITARGGN
jgi:protein tyrosine/serine phosphatase